MISPHSAEMEAMSMQILEESIVLLLQLHRLITPLQLLLLQQLLLRILLLGSCFCHVFCKLTTLLLHVFVMFSVSLTTTTTTASFFSSSNTNNNYYNDNNKKSKWTWSWS